MESQLGATNPSLLAATADRRRSDLQTDRTFLIVATGQLGQCTAARSRELNVASIGRPKRVADANPAIQQRQIDFRQQLVLGGNLFELSLLDDSATFSQFGAEVQQLRDALFPIEVEASQRGFLDRSNQAAVGGGQSQQFAKRSFAAVNTEAIVAEQVGSRQCRGQSSAEVVVLLLGLCQFLFGAGPVVQVQLGELGRRDGAVASDHRRRNIAIGDVQIPVSDFDIADQVADLDLEVGDRNVFVQTRQHHRNPVDHRAAVSHQRMLHLGFDNGCPVAGHLAVDRGDVLPERLVVSGVQNLLSQCCHTTRGKSLANGCLLSRVEALIERIGERHTSSPRSRSRVSRSVGCPRIDERAGLGVEFTQRVFHAADLIGSQHASWQNPVAVAVDLQRDRLSGRLLDRHVVDAAELVGAGAGELSGNVLTELSVAAGRDEKLGILQRDRDAFLDRQVPELVVVIAHRQGRLGLASSRQDFPPRRRDTRSSSQY